MHATRSACRRQLQVRTFAAAALLPLALAAAGQSTPPEPALPPVRLLVFPSPGLFDELPGGRIGGTGGALLAKIGQASDVAYETASLPIARTVATALTQPNSCIVGVVRTPERETLFHWVGLVSRAGLAVYGRDDAETPPLGSLTDLRGRTTVVVRETVNASQLRDQGIAAQEVSSALSALRMLRARRVDYWYSHTLVAHSAATAASGAPIKAVFSGLRVDGYMACHLDMPAALVERLRQGLLRLRRQGDLAEFGLR